jgi:hypothetical protein
MPVHLHYLPVHLSSVHLSACPIYLNALLDACLSLCLPIYSLPICLPVLLAVCLPSFLSVRLSASHLSASLSVCLLFGLPEHLSAFLSICHPQSACLSLCLPLGLPVYLSTCLHSCLLICLPSHPLLPVYQSAQLFHKHPSDLSFIFRRSATTIYCTYTTQYAYCTVYNSLSMPCLSLKNAKMKILTMIYTLS